MLPRDLKAEQFAGYPPDAKVLVLAHLAAIRQVPISFAPSLLREVIDYDFKFPAERTSIDGELASLSSLTPAQIQDEFREFNQITLPAKLEEFDWVNQPAQFVEQQAAYLWSTHQMDAFRKAATDYGTRLRQTAPVEAAPMRRLGIAVIGQGVTSWDAPLFRNLRAHGTYFGQIKPESGLKFLLTAVADRAKAHPMPYGHWYIDGGQLADHSSLLTCVSYKGLEPMRTALLKNIDTEVKKPGMGPEELRTYLAQLSSLSLGMGKAKDAVMDRFQVKLFTEGSGTQIFSTTFAQWTAREALRRAQPITMLVRYAPRQRQKPMNELLSSGNNDSELDPAGSLVDAEMGSYYHWVNQQRLPGAEQSSFLVWFEGHGKAIAIGPYLPRGTESNSAMNLHELLALAVG
jgi:hypothetical protein